MMNKHYLPIIIFFFIIPIFYIGLDRNKSELPSPLVGKEMPKFSLPSLQNSNHIIDNSNFDYEVFLLNVWATWCSGCLEEHPFLMQLSKTNQIPIIGLNWRDNKKDAIDWLENYGDPYNLIANDNLGRVAIDWGVYGAPESFLVDSNGIIIHKHLGPLNKKIWEQDFVSLIRDVKNK